MHCGMEPFRLKFRRRKQGRSTEWHAWLYLKAEEVDVELLHLTATSKRDIQKAMGNRLEDWGMKLSLLAPEARRDDMCIVDGKPVCGDWTCDQDDW